MKTPHLPSEYIKDTTLDPFFDKNPVDLTDEDLDEIIAVNRAAYKEWETQDKAKLKKKGKLEEWDMDKPLSDAKKGEKE